MKKIFLIIVIFSSCISAQTIYELPFASKGNVIELAVSNTSTVAMENITVNVLEKPAWISFEKCESLLSKIEMNSEAPASFEFSVDKDAPIGEEGKIIFAIKSPNGDEWRKEINVEVSAPTTYELSQNYPNPFNPTTTIEFIIPHDEKVVIKVYDILGREVRTWLNEFREAGHHEVEFSASGGNASQLASGMYIYRMTSGNYSQIRKMMLVK